MSINLKTVASHIMKSLSQCIGHRKTSIVHENDTIKTTRDMSMHLTVTEAARTKIKEMCIENGMVAVRPFIMGGGCAGLQHQMTFADAKERRDTEVAPYVYVDPVTMSFMDGATIVYDTSGFNPTFVFHDVFKHMGGTGTCGGCGAAMGPGNYH